MNNIATDTFDDDAADTLRFRRLDLDAEAPSDPDATSIYDLRAPPPPCYVGRSAPLRRQIRGIRENLARLREAIAEGWDVGPELDHEEHRLATLEAG